MFSSLSPVFLQRMFKKAISVYDIKVTPSRRSINNTHGTQVLVTSLILIINALPCPFPSLPAVFWSFLFN